MTPFYWCALGIIIGTIVGVAMATMWQMLCKKLDQAEELGVLPNWMKAKS